MGLFHGYSEYDVTLDLAEEHHGTMAHVAVSYNVAVDSSWLFLVEPVNTDFGNVLFTNNTVLHLEDVWEEMPSYFNMMAGAVNKVSKSGVAYEVDNQYYKKDVGFQPGTVIVKNNIFVDGFGTRRNPMFNCNLADHGNNLFVPADASLGNLKLGTDEATVAPSSLGLQDTFRLSAGSTSAIDRGVAVDMSSSVSMGTAQLDPSLFQNTFNQDLDTVPVPCGSGRDIGASEYCAGNPVYTGGSMGVDAGLGGGGAGGSVGSGGVTSSRPVNGDSGAGGAGKEIDAGFGGAKSDGALGTGGVSSSGGKSGKGGDGSQGSGGPSSGGTGFDGAMGGGGGSKPGGTGVGGAGQPGGTAGVSGATGAGGTPKPKGGSKGCSCQMGAREAQSPTGLLLMLAMAGLLRATRRCHAGLRRWAPQREFTTRRSEKRV
jgi:hypothetical protein